MFITALRNDHLLDRQFVLTSEEEVPLVMGRHTHHGPGAVFRQDVVSNPDREQFAVGGVTHLGANRDAALGFVLRGALLLALTRDQVAEGLDFRLVGCAGQTGHQGVLWSQHDIARPKHGVRAGGEHGDPFIRVLTGGIDHRELELSTGAAADPVGLHRAHPFRPTLQFREVIQQLLGVVGDLQEPLTQLALLNQRAGTPGTAFAVHLLIGEHGLVNGVPIDGGVLLIGQAGLEELKEQPLGPAVVVSVASRQLALPVDREPELIQLIAHGRDVLVRPGPWVDTPFDCCVLRGQTKGVPSHWMEHLFSA